MDLVSEIKSRLNIEDIVSQYVQLKKSGKSFKGLCPFHQEKTPSFMVSPEKQLAYCFGCHKGGDIIKFIEEIEGVEFLEATKILADKAGIDPSEYQKSSLSKYSKTEREELFDIHNHAASFYKNLLWNSEEGGKVLNYLKNRGLKDESIEHFQIGISPDSFNKTHLDLVKKGFSRKMLALSGISIAKDIKSNEIYDRFRQRLIFPIKDSMGRIVGFGGRALKKGDEPKYLNSPDSPIYRKSEILYGFHDAKPEIKKKGNIILVEGYFDVIMSYQEGAQNVVATSGTALTLKQIKLLKRLTKDFLFCFDTDKAGIEAAKRGFELAQQESVNVKVINVPNAKDPADFIKNNPEKWIEIIENPIPFMDFCIDECLKRYEINSIEGKKSFLSEILPYIKVIQSSIEKDHYIREIAQKLAVKEVQIYDELKKVKQFSVIPDRKSKKIVSKNKKMSITDLTISMIYVYNTLLEKYFDKIPFERLTSDQKTVYNQFKDNYNLLRKDASKKELLSRLEEEVRRDIELNSMFIEEAYDTFNDQMIEKEFLRLIEREKEQWLEAQKRSISKQIKEAEKNGNTNDAKELLIKLNQLVNN